MPVCCNIKCHYTLQSLQRDPLDLIEFQHRPSQNIGRVCIIKYLYQLDPQLPRLSWRWSPWSLVRRRSLGWGECNYSIVSNGFKESESRHTLESMPDQPFASPRSLGEICLMLRWLAMLSKDSNAWLRDTHILCSWGAMEAWRHPSLETWSEVSLVNRRIRSI